MSYIKSTIINGEEIIHEAKMSKWFFVGEILLGSLCFIVGFVAQIGFLMHGNIEKSSYNFNYFLIILGAIILLKVYITYISTELAFTNKRVIAKVGFIKRDTVEMNISKVETIQVHQSILGRILNYGTVIISGAGNPQAHIRGIANPMKFRTTFMEYTSKNI